MKKEGLREGLVCFYFCKCSRCETEWRASGLPTECPNCKDYEKVTIDEFYNEVSPEERALSDHIADLVNQLQQTNVSFDSLVEKLTPGDAFNRASVEISSLSQVVGRTPTPTEFQAYLMGVVSVIHGVFPDKENVSEWMDEQGFPCVTCCLCKYKVPAAMAIFASEGEHIKKRWYCLDGCVSEAAVSRGY